VVKTVTLNESIRDFNRDNKRQESYNLLLKVKKQLFKAKSKNIKNIKEICSLQEKYNLLYDIQKNNKNLKEIKAQLRRNLL
jgi:hypothetical protein